MRETKKNRMTVVCAVACVLTFAAAGPAAETKAGQDAASVPVVKNGKQPAAGTRFALEPLWSAGGESSPADFADISGIAVDAKGEVLVLDSKDCRVHVFDAKGKLLRSFGRKGQGPGELSGPGTIHLTPANEILVEEALTRRLSYFSRDGKPLRQVSTAQGMGMGMAGLVMDAQGRIAARNLSFEGGKMGFDMRIYDKDLRPGPLVSQVTLGTIGQGKIDLLASIPGMIMAPDGKGNLYVGSMAGYRINVFGFDGRPRRAIEREFDAVPVRKEDEEKLFKILGGVPATGGFNLKEMIKIPTAFPAYQGFIAEPSGRLLVRTYEKGRAEREYFYDLFDAAGRYVGRFPSTVDFAVWRDGRIYGSEEDVDGFKILKCFKVVG